MTDDATEIVAALRRRLKKIDKDRDKVLADLRYYGARMASTNGVRPRAAKRQTKARRMVSRNAPELGRPWQRPVGGPMDRLLEVLKESPSGLTYSEAVNRALEGYSGSATNPKRAMESVLWKMKKKGDLVSVRDGKYYPKE